MLIAVGRVPLRYFSQHCSSHWLVLHAPEILSLPHIVAVTGRCASTQYVRWCIASRLAGFVHLRYFWTAYGMHEVHRVHVLWFRCFGAPHNPVGVYITPTTCVSACVCAGSCMTYSFLLNDYALTSIYGELPTDSVDCVGLVIPVELPSTSDRCTFAAAARQHMVCLHISCKVMHLKGVDCITCASTSCASL
jgi:hypothetical protein